MRYEFEKRYEFEPHLIMPFAVSHKILDQLRDGARCILTFDEWDLSHKNDQIVKGFILYREDGLVFLKLPNDSRRLLLKKWVVLSK